MDATKWTQGFQEMINVKPMEQMMIPTNLTQPTCNITNSRTNNVIINDNSSNNNSNSNNNNNTTMLERKPRPQEKLNCPRCNSTNTKFCYYNNYSLTQPRYFCKGCRRYWTEGGSLRNVPVGGSSRKNKRSSSSSAILPSSSSPSPSLGLTNKLLPDLNPPILFPNQNPKTTQKGSSQDLNLLSFPVMQEGHPHHQHTNMSQFLHMHKIENSITQPNPTCSATPLYVSSSPVSAMELLRTGVSSRGFNTFMPGPMVDSNAVLYSSGFSLMPDYKTSNLSFSADHQGLGNNNNNNNNGGRVLFPFSEMKELSSTTQEVDDHNQIKSQGNSSTNAYWTGMFSTTGGGPSW